MYQFACPTCGARLRVKDKSFAGRTVDCPECREPVSIQVAADGSLSAVAQPQHSTRSSPAQRRVPDRSPGKPRVAPALIAWGVALAGFVALLIAVFRGGSDMPSDPTAEVEQTAENPPPEQPAEPAVAADSPEGRLAAVGSRLSAYRDNHGVFPATAVQPGVPVERRLSWIAMLIASEGESGVQPDLDRPWDDAANDRFVRQRVEPFQNPNIETLTGPGGHPVSHYAGIAGTGADAAGLPASHPRAGIFGAQRTTRVEDIKDGLASTMMVAGVQDRVDSWAGAGAATVRPLTTEPYFSGPDGFGTGEQGGMSVLMADGSVRFLSADTDPRLMRRMAAMADGLPLDLATPGEPGEASPEPPPVAVIPQPVPPPDGPDAEPITVPLAANEPLFDMEAALNQPVVEFNQPTPRPIGEILKLVAELAGVVVDASQLDEVAAGRLEQATTLALNATTVREVLDATVHAAGLEYSLGDGVVVLIAGESPAR